MASSLTGMAEHAGSSLTKQPLISSDITEVMTMPDLLIRDFPPEDLELLDQQARRLGLSRAEYLRRQLHQSARQLNNPVTVADLVNLAELVTDLDDDSVMTSAWS